MRIYIYIGMDGATADRMQSVLNDKRDQMSGKGVLYARTPGARNHTRLFMSVTDPDNIDTLRFNRGYISPEKQTVLREDVAKNLAREIEQNSPDTFIVSAHQFGTSLARKSEMERLRALLLPFSDDIRIVAHVEDPARMLSRYFASQVIEGRARSLDLEMGLLDSESWWDAARETRKEADPQRARFAEVQGAPFWLDFARLVSEWDSVFGEGATQLRALDHDLINGPDVTDEIRAAFDIPFQIGKAEPHAPAPPPPEAWLSRCRQMNDVLLRYIQLRKAILPRLLWRKFMAEIRVGGTPLDPGSLHAISKHFANDIKGLTKKHKGLNATVFKADKRAADWQEADPKYGFRATQYLMAFHNRIDRATKEEQKTKAADLARLSVQGVPDTAPAEQPDLSPSAQELMPPLAKQNFEKLKTSSFAPHNEMGRVNEEELAAAYSSIEQRNLPKGNSGNVIVGCMKNEAPYIVEWVAYHRAMGVDNFLIYTNGCDDGTSEILDRLQEMGVLQHRNNDNWKGNSPQQYALNQSLKEPVIKNAEWIIHIDVDEFMNVRCGNGTLADFFERVPDATNVAMTWRLFGHNGVTDLNDEFVLEQFDTCAPKFCPKPHTVWGFKTMFKNIGAYEKISCHRPNKLDESFKDKVKWVNGSGIDMTEEARDNGWRNSKKTIGYDLLQLNHYALRSAESFLIKRQRGRALHVDRSIGLNYWIRMDWSNFKDITIKRNVPRLHEEYDRLMQDSELNKWHQKGLKWHRAKADELHQMPEFEDLYQQAVKLRLTETERVAYALALDMES